MIPMPVEAGKHEPAIRLFRFLKELTELRTKTIRTLDNYEKVLWLEEIPHEEGCYCAVWRENIDEAADNWIEIQRPQFFPPPEVPEELKLWMDPEQVGDSSVDFPELRGHIIETRQIQDDLEGETEHLVTVYLSERPEINDMWEQYVEKLWWPWAEKEKKLKPIQNVYTDLFCIYQKQQRLGEMYEVVLGLGLLLWKTPAGQEVCRHLITAQASIDFDAARGVITVGVGSEGARLTLEQDMLEATERPPVDVLRAIEKQLEKIGEAVWEKAPIETALKSWIYSVSSRGSFQDTLSVPSSSSLKKEPSIFWTPALILRKRNERNLIYVFQEIIRQLEKDKGLPLGVRRLVEIIDDSMDENSGQEKSFLADDVYFPLQYNQEQLEIIRRISTRHGVLVQGPPGTGKSQTIANLVCHLLATGKRVLVTSQTPRALKVLSRMIPNEVAALCVSLLGYDRSSLQELEDCIVGITDKYNQWNQAENQKNIKNLEKLLDETRRNEATILGHLKALREEETYTHVLQNGHYQGTMGSIAKQLKEEEGRYSWISDATRDGEPPLCNAEAAELIALLREISEDRKIELQQKTIELSKLPEPADFLAFVHNEKLTSSRFQENKEAKNHPSYPALLKTGHKWRDSLLEGVRDLVSSYNQLCQHPHPWVRQATVDILSDQANKWRELLNYTQEQFHKIETLTDTAANTVSGLENQNRDNITAVASALLQHLEAGRGLGFGPFRPKVVRDGKYLMQSVYVDGQLCNNKEALKKLLKWLEREKLLDALFEHWSFFEEVTGPFTVQLSSYKDLSSVLLKIIVLREKADNLDLQIASIPGIKKPVWHDLQKITAFQEAIVAISCEEELARSKEPFQHLEKLLQEKSLQEGVHSVIVRLLNAVRQRDVHEYGEAYHFLRSLENDAEALKKRDIFLRRLRQELPELVDELLSSYQEVIWNERMAHFEEAWHWTAASCWLNKRMGSTDFERLTGMLFYYRGKIREIMKQLVESKAWVHFFSRLEEEQRQHLMAWASAMRKIGKGTGKYTAQYRRDARMHMEKCRPAIPAWIMPIFRVAESVVPRVNAFDVVIVDEASQSGPEALFLHYLAPKIIVVGDDKQISPEHVGIDREDVNVLRERHIADLPLNDLYSLEDSFFDQAVARFGGRIRLKEHFRCMPEIIQFCNNICYQAEPLIPLRQRAAGRLSSIKVTHVPDGYRRSSKNKIENPPEAEAIVKQIIQCCQNPSYKGKTMGVISLQSESQARLIEKLLLKEIGPEETERRQLLCGDAYAFQGDERDIIFLSLVAAPSEEKRIGTLSSEKHQRRFNVAVSRAKDQLWLFHTATLNDLSSKCFRYKLLEYCLNPKVEQIIFEDEVINPDVLVQPFESLFEQHVYCKIRERGYHVVPQYNVAGYRIDLVVSGIQGQLAVECAGDRWHGPEQYEADMERQRQLERCKWTFWRIRASSFYRDPDKAMESLWKELDRLKIYPSVKFEKEKEAKDAKNESQINNKEKRKEGISFQTFVRSGHEGKVISLKDCRRINNAEKSKAWDLIVKEYVHWEQRPLPDPRDATIKEITEGLVEIISVEGPVIIHRVFRLYLKAAGIGRLGDYIKSRLINALQRAITKGVVLEANELGCREKLNRVVLLINTPRVVLRSKGNRNLNEIPQSEIAGIMIRIIREKGLNPDEKEIIFRSALEYYGLSRMTKKSYEILDRAFKLSKQGNELFKGSNK